MVGVLSLGVEQMVVELLASLPWHCCLDSPLFERKVVIRLILSLLDDVGVLLGRTPQWVLCLLGSVDLDVVDGVGKVW